MFYSRIVLLTNNHQAKQSDIQTVEIMNKYLICFEFHDGGEFNGAYEQYQ